MSAPSHRIAICAVPGADSSHWDYCCEIPFALAKSQGIALYGMGLPHSERITRHSEKAKASVQNGIRNEKR